STTKRVNPRAEARQAAQRRQRLMFIGIGVVVVALAVLIGVLSAGDTSDHLTTSEVARDVEIEGEALPVFAGSVDPTIGEPAPVIEGESFDGSPVSIGEGDSPQIIAFLASWCPACQEELP